MATSKRNKKHLEFDLNVYGSDSDSSVPMKKSKAGGLSQRDLDQMSSDDRRDAYHSALSGDKKTGRGSRKSR